RQTLRHSFPLSTGKQRDDLLVLARDRAQNRIGLGNEGEQNMAQLIERDLLIWRSLALRKFVKAYRLGRLGCFLGFHVQKFIKASLAFGKGEQLVPLQRPQLTYGQ